VAERPLCAHNAPTERKFLQQAFPLLPLGPWIDTLKLVRTAYPSLSSHKLEDLVETLSLRSGLDELLPGLGPHDALYDAVACAFLLEHLLSLPEWHGITLEALSI
jgi:DNA polymerase III epsilon subunit-like protein